MFRLHRKCNRINTYNQQPEKKYEERKIDKNKPKMAKWRQRLSYVI